MLKFASVLFCLFIVTGNTFSQEKIFLNNWHFSCESKQHPALQKSYSATIPSVVHLDLMANNLVDDFYNNNNENAPITKWIEEQNWIYSTSFFVDEKLLKQKNKELVFEGLDTYATIFLNDSLVLEANNMFRIWTVALNECLRYGENTLVVKFTSPLNYHRKQVRTAKYELPSGNENVDLKVSAYSRKAAYQFGWDFGPRFVSCGIWKPCYIKSWNDFILSDFCAETISLSGTNALMQFQFLLESDSTYIPPYKIEMLGKVFEVYIQKGKNIIKFYHEFKDAKLWYPNGFGKQTIYSSTINLLNSNNEIVLSKDVNFAIRKIELINEPDSIGTSFYFKVNNQPIFIKGANYVPQDLFLPRVSNEQTKKLLTQVKSANMNMLRVWGGGIYESEYFYSLCDSLGILIWQDFMFANSMYPADTLFHQNVVSEIEDNVKRLRNHPCIALWCGNNEIEVAWQNYLLLFHDLIPKSLQQLDSSRSYIPSSPQSNWGKAENFNHGAMHYWGVWHGKEPLSNFKTNVGRFMVEYGFQSYPLFTTLVETLDNSVHRDSADFKNRQKSYIGDVLIQAEIQKYFGDLPKVSDWLLASQYIQAEALKLAIQSHRLKAPHCMGTLFWQLNDCWPGPSWSVLDYYGNEKLGYSFVNRAYSPAIVVVDTTDNYLTVIIQSDIPFKGQLVLSPHLPNSSKKVKQLHYSFEIEPLAHKIIVKLKLNKYFKKYPKALSGLDILIYDPASNQHIFNDYFRFTNWTIEDWKY